MNKKKTIIFSNYDSIGNPYYSGGGAIAIHEIAKKISSSYDVSIITAKFKNSSDEKIDNITYKRIGYPFGNPQFEQFVYQLLLPFYAMSQKFDVWIENFTPPFSTGFLQLVTKKPVIGLVHMLCAADMERKYKLPFHVIEDFGLRTYRYFIVLSKYSKALIQKKNAESFVTIIPNGIHHEKPMSTNNKKYILFMGRLEVNQKGLDLLLESYKTVQDELDFSLVIAGSGMPADQEILKSLVRKLHLGKNIIFVGRIEGEKKKRLLRNAIFVVIPSRYETYSLIALESLNYGIPIVCFDIPGLRWIPKSVSIKIPIFNSHMFGKAMVKLSKDIKLRKLLSERGRKLVTLQTWDNIAKKYKTFVNTILKHHG